MMKFVLTSLVSLLVLGATETAELTGTVRSKSGKPLAGVVVSSRGFKPSETDSEGRCDAFLAAPRKMLALFWLMSPVGFPYPALHGNCVGVHLPLPVTTLLSNSLISPYLTVYLESIRRLPVLKTSPPSTGERAR